MDFLFLNSLQMDICAKNDIELFWGINKINREYIFEFVKKNKNVVICLTFEHFRENSYKDIRKEIEKKLAENQFI